MTDITLKNTKMRVVTIEFDLAGHPIPEEGATIAVSVDATDKMTATLEADNSLLVDCIAVDGAVGTATLTVTGTLPDGVVLVQTLGFMIVQPDADTIVLTAGPEQDKPVPAPAL